MNYSGIPYKDMVVELEGIFGQIETITSDARSNFDDFYSQPITPVKGFSALSSKLLFLESFKLFALVNELSEYLDDIKKKNINPTIVDKLSDVGERAFLLALKLGESFNRNEKGTDFLESLPKDRRGLLESVYSITRDNLHLLQECGDISLELEMYLPEPSSNSSVSVEILDNGGNEFDDLSWENLTIQFVNLHNVILKIHEKIIRETTFEGMGFKDERTGLPNKQWDFLYYLAGLGGYLSWDNNQDLLITARDKAKSRKYQLSKALKKYFKLDDEPFLDYDRENGYRVKFNLLPDASDIDTSGISRETFEYFSEHAPSVLVSDSEEREGEE